MKVHIETVSDPVITSETPPKGDGVVSIMRFSVTLASDEGPIDEEWWASWDGTEGIVQSRPPQHYPRDGNLLMVQCGVQDKEGELKAIDAMLSEANLAHARRH